MVDPTGLDDAEEVFAAVIARPANARTALAVRARLAGEHVASVSPTGPPAPFSATARRAARLHGAHPLEPCPAGLDAVAPPTAPGSLGGPDDAGGDRITFYKVGRLLRFDPAEVGAWLDRSRRAHRRSA